MVMYNKDVQLVTGKRERASRNLINAILEKNGKKRGQKMISVGEFCEYTGLPEAEVLRRLADRKP